MSVLVYDIENKIDDKSKVKSKNIICPECKEDIKMNIKDYKINLFGCKNNHSKNDILFDEFEKTQIIDLKDIKCGLCQDNKAKTYKNDFYRCYECKKNLCPLCKTKHDKSHNVYNYDKLNIICNKHNEPFTNYCKKCNSNICYLCEEEHKEHEIILLRKLMIDKKELIIKLNELKKSIDLFNEDINKIIEVLYNVKENLDNYYKIEEYIINNYDKNERNYEILYNINEFINFNNNVLKDINNENLIEIKFKNIFNIYNRINNRINNTINKNEIKLKLNIRKEDVNTKIYFLDNTDEEVYLAKKGQREEHHHDFLKELNESNVELYINNKKYNYQKYFIPEKQGIYEILLIFNIMMTDCSYMFYKCYSLTNIDLSSFNTQNVNNMNGMFSCCYNLTNINLSCFNTKNVTDMSDMFSGCSNLTNINLSSFNTQNVKIMSGMFFGCSNLTNINLSSFNTQNVINMENMFYSCSNLKNIVLTSFKTQNVKTMFGMFYNCSSLTNIDLSSFNTQNVDSMSCMFYNCPNLTNIDLSSFNTQNVYSMSCMFYNCSNLTNINLSSFNTQNNNNIDRIFYGCSNLKEIKLNKNSNIRKEIDEKKTKIIFI